MNDLSDLRQRTVFVAGAGISGLAAARALLAVGARVVVGDDNPEALTGLPEGADEFRPGTDSATIPAGTSLIITSPGRHPDHPLVAAASERGIELIGEPELAWRLGRAAGSPPAWLVVTGTNGKTTATGMLATILQAAGLDAVACGNIGHPVVSAVTEGRAVLAVELSSFQLHWSPSIRPDAGAVINIAEDHLDWHGGLPGYVAAKARALTGDVAVAGVDDELAAGLLESAPAPRKVGVTLVEPQPGQLGIAGGQLVDRAFGTPTGKPVPLADAAAVRPGGPPGLTDALVAAALARAYGVAPAAVRDGLAVFGPGPHRGALVGEVAGVRYLDDSKATNPHAADAALTAVTGGRIVWILGGLLKGASVDAVIARHAPRLAGVVVIGADRAEIRAALARHAAGVPVHEVESGDDGPMKTAVHSAAVFARPGDAVLLAPAAASMDQFRDYAARGAAFAAAVRELGAAVGGGCR